MGTEREPSEDYPFPQSECLARHIKSPVLPQGAHSLPDATTGAVPLPIPPHVPAADVAPTFGDLFDLEEIQRIQDAFAIATGVASIITDPDGRPLTRPSKFCRLCRDIVRKAEKGLANCMRSDALLGRPHPSGPIVQPCLSCGLWCGGASIFAGHYHIANWLVGQVRNEALNEQAMLNYARDLGVDAGEFMTALAEVMVMPTEQFQQVCQALFLVANQMSQRAFQTVQLARHIGERMLAEQERDRLEAQLRHAQKMEAVGQLAGGIAHDFNNILTTILGNAELATERLEALGLPDPLLSDELEQIEHSARRASDLTRQLLTFSRRQVTQPQVLDLNEILTEMERMLRRLLAESIDFRTILDPSLHSVLADASQLEQVIINLAVNARDAMPEGGTLTIRTANTDLNETDVAASGDACRGPHVVLTVTDTGRGMDPETAERIFEPFFSTKSVGEGTGLGLATVHGIVRQANGHMRVHSEPGEGTSMAMYLPAAESAPAGRPAIASANAPRGGTETILVCEDDQAVRELVERMLHDAGYTVLGARNGEHALRVASQRDHPVDVLVTDVIMPGLNGRQVADALRKSIPGLRVLFVSGYTSSAIAHHGVLGDDVQLLQKPFSRELMLRRVRELLDAPSAAASPS